MAASLYSQRVRDNHNLARYERLMLVVIVAFAVTMLVLAIRANNVVRSGRVLRLVEREFSLKPLVACLACFVVSVLVMWLSARTLESPAEFVTFIVAFAVGVVSMLIVVASEVMRRTAVGALTLVDAKTLRVHLRGSSAFTVDSVRVTKTTTPEYARFEVNESLRLVGVVPLDMWESIAGDAQPPSGTRIAGSSRALLEWAQS